MSSANHENSDQSALKSALSNVAFLILPSYHVITTKDFSISVWDVPGHMTEDKYPVVSRPPPPFCPEARTLHPRDWSKIKRLLSREGGDDEASERTRSERERQERLRQASKELQRSWGQTEKVKQKYGKRRNCPHFLSFPLTTSCKH